MQTPRRYGIYILGDGFSCAAGLPLAAELWKEIRKRVRKMSGRATKFDRDLEDYIRFRNVCYGEHLHADSVDFEDFMGFLDLEHYLRLRGSDTWSEEGNETQVLTKILIGQVLTEATPSAEGVPGVYLRFAELLRPEDRVFTFNYDVLLERALEKIGKPFRLFPSRYSKVHSGVGGYAEADTSRDEIVVLKLHGSIDWFDRRQYARRVGGSRGDKASRQLSDFWSR